MSATNSPSISSKAAPGQGQRPKGQLFVAIVFALFLVPLLTAVVLVQFWRPASTVNHGELLTTAQPAEAFNVQHQGQPPLDFTALQRRWTLVTLAPVGGCGEACQEVLNNVGHLRLLLGKDRPRLRYALASPEPLTSAEQRFVAERHPELFAGVADAATVGFLRQAFPKAELTAPNIYLFDPLGNLVMRYGAEVDPKGILKDLKRLFKYSQLG